MARLKGSKNKQPPKSDRPSKKKKRGKGKPWSSNYKGNQLGRPKKGEAMTDILREIGENFSKDTKYGRLLFNQALGIKIWDLALRGVRWAGELLYDRLDGRAMARAELSGPGGGPIEIAQLSATERQARIDKLLAERQTIIDAKK
jgi:hypothetical protein